MRQRRPSRLPIPLALLSLRLGFDCAALDVAPPQKLADEALVRNLVAVCAPDEHAAAERKTAIGAQSLETEKRDSSDSDICLTSADATARPFADWSK